MVGLTSADWQSTASNENSLGVHSVGRVFLERREIVAEPRLSQIRGPDAPILIQPYL
jgi:hypothetical protein